MPSLPSGSIALLHARAAKTHDKANIWATTRDLDGKKLNVFDLMWFSLIMTTSAVPHPWNHRLVRSFHGSRHHRRRKLRLRVNRRWERFGYRCDPYRRCPDSLRWAVAGLSRHDPCRSAVDGWHRSDPLC